MAEIFSVSKRSFPAEPGFEQVQGLQMPSNARCKSPREVAAVGEAQLTGHMVHLLNLTRVKHILDSYAFPTGPFDHIRQVKGLFVFICGLSQ